MTLNWSQWAAPLCVLFYIFILLPLQIVVFAGLAVGFVVSKAIGMLRGLPGKMGWRS